MAYLYTGEDSNSNKSMDTIVNNSLLASDTNSSYEPVEETKVELYTIIWSLVILFIVAILGLLCNLAILLSSKCKRTLRTLHYGLPYNLSMAHILLCVFWMPLQFAQVVENFSAQPVHETVCYINVCVFHLGFGAVVCTVMFAILQQLYHLWTLNQPSERGMIIAGVIVSWAVAALAATCIGFEYSNTLDYAICNGGFLRGSNRAAYNMDNFITPTVFSTIYLLAFLFIFLTMLAIVIQKRTILRQALLHQACTDACNRIHGINEIQSDEMMSNNKSSDTLFKEKQADSSSATASTSSKQASSKGSAKKVSMAVDEDEEDDDAFDMKMRMNIRKGSSGRRHTVANIGLGDAGLGMRRGSLGETGSKNKNMGYQYIRKWSVDITALQDQLENPKCHSGDPFKELKALKEKEMKKSEDNENVAEKKPEPKESKPRPTVTLSDKIEEIEDTSEHLFFPDPPVLSANGSNGGTDDDKRPVCKQGLALDEDTIGSIEKEITYTLKYVPLWIVTVVFLSMYVIVQFLQGHSTNQLNRNLNYIMSSAILFLSVLHPIIFAWMDPTICQALQRLKFNLTSWKCVCYCNIGKGKQCFGPRHEYQESVASA